MESGNQVSRPFPYAKIAKSVQKQIQNNKEMLDNIVFYKKECMATNKDIASVIIGDYPSFFDAIIGGRSNFEKIVHIAVDLVVKNNVSENYIKTVHKRSLSDYQKDNPRPQHLASMRERSCAKEEVFNWNDKHREVLVELCLKYRRGWQISKNTVIAIFQQMYPDTNYGMIDRMITRRGISDTSPWVKYPEYESFLETCMISLVEDEDSPYRLIGKGKNKINNKLIEKEFNAKFPKAIFTSKALKDKCFKIRKALGINVSNLS